MEPSVEGAVLQRSLTTQIFGQCDVNTGVGLCTHWAQVRGVGVTSEVQPGVTWVTLMRGGEAEHCTEALWEPFGRQNTDKQKLQIMIYLVWGRHKKIACRQSGAICSLFISHLQDGVGPRANRCQLITLEYLSFRSSALLARILPLMSPPSRENTFSCVGTTAIGGVSPRWEQVRGNECKCVPAGFCLRFSTHLHLSQP